MDWNEKQVWQWLTSKNYVEKLDVSTWEFTDGPTLLELDFESAQKLQVPTVLIPRLLKDIKSLTKESEALALIGVTDFSQQTHDSTLQDHSKRIKKIADRVSSMDHRNQIKDFNKEFEGSLARIIIIMGLTYAVLSVYMLLVNIDRPWINAIVPTFGFQLSTLSLPSIKAYYVEHRMSKIKPQ